MARTKRRPRHRRATAVPAMLMEMALASAETISRRSAMILAGTCSAAEYQRMVAEKAKAVQRSGAALANPRIRNRAVAALAPWHQGVTANAKRLRRKKR